MKRIGILMFGFFFCFVSSARSQVAPQPKPKIITFDVIGAGTGFGQGTVPYGITAFGGIIGWYTDQNGLNHGFLRSPDGTIAKFDAPNAAPVSVEGVYQGTMAFSLNAEGVVVGIYVDPGAVVHGFVRTLDGKLKTYDAPNAGTSSGQGTWICNINDAGTISGAYIDSVNLIHAYEFTLDGKYTVFEAPGAGTGAMQGTDNPTMYGLNAAGVMAGWYIDAGNVYHGYLHYPYGKITTFDDANAAAGPYQGTQPFSVNAEGEAAGNYYDANNISHGFVRTPTGKITTYDAPGAVGGTYISSSNASGAIAGAYVDASGNVHGFQYMPTGHFIGIDVLGAVYGTYVFGNNAVGVVIGNYVDGNGANHGFMMIPYAF